MPGWYPCLVDSVGRHMGSGSRASSRRAARSLAMMAAFKGMQSILWFEPERVTKGSWLALNHPAWVLAARMAACSTWAIPRHGVGWSDHIDKIIVAAKAWTSTARTSTCIPGPRRANDPDDRQGITEIKHVQGDLAYWDELHRRHPGMLIDSVRERRSAK